MVCGEDCVGVFVHEGLVGLVGWEYCAFFLAVQVYSGLYNQKSHSYNYSGHSKLGPEALQRLEAGRSIVDLLFSETSIHLNN